MHSIGNERQGSHGDSPIEKECQVAGLMRKNPV